MLQRPIDAPVGRERKELIRRLCTIAGAISVLATGCENENKAGSAPVAGTAIGVVASVDSENISSDELRKFRGDGPGNGQEKAAPSWRETLDTLIEMKMMLLEARDQGIELDPEFISALADREEKILVADYLKREVKDKIDLPQAQLLEDFKKSKWSRMLKLAYIRVETEPEANQVMEALRQGRPFAAVAREFSNDPRAPQGGLLDPYFGRGNIIELGLPFAMADDVFELEVGEHSPAFEFAGGYEVLQVVDERPASHDYARRFAQTQITLAFKKGKQDLVAELAKEYNLQLDHDVLSVLIERARDFAGDVPVLAAAERDMVFCRYDGGRLTLQDFVDAQKETSYPVKYDIAGTVQFATKFVLVQPLLSLEAVNAKERDQEDIVLMKIRKEAMLIEALKRREVDDRIDLSEQSVRRYYENNIDQFLQREEIELIEVLVATESEANDLVERILNGEDMESLAAANTIRDEAVRDHGRYHLHPRERSRYGTLVDEAMNAPVDSLTGPVKLEGGRKAGYSVFKVISRTPATPRPFEAAARQARQFLKNEVEERLLEELFGKLGQKYQSKVEIYEEQLATMDQ